MLLPSWARWAFLAVIVAASFPAYGQTRKPLRPPTSSKPAEADDEAVPEEPKDARLGMKDIARMRRTRTSHDAIVEKATEQHVRFEITPAVKNQLRRMGFTPDQINTIKDAYQVKTRAQRNPAVADGDAAPAGAVVAGHQLKITDAERDQIRADIAHIAWRGTVIDRPRTTRMVSSSSGLY